MRTRFIHLVDTGRLGAELRPMCGAWSDDITWTTLPQAMTCPACGRLVRGGDRFGNEAVAPRAEATPHRHLDGGG